MFMEWFGGNYFEFMRMPVTRRKRVIEWKSGRELERQDAERQGLARLDSMMRRRR